MFYINCTRGRKVEKGRRKKGKEKEGRKEGSRREGGKKEGRGEKRELLIALTIEPFMLTENAQQIEVDPIKLVLCFLL